MQIQLVSVGERMPLWGRQGYEEYARRLPRECSLKLREIPPAKRGKSTAAARWLDEEGQRILSALPQDECVVALDQRGVLWDTRQLAEALRRWLGSGRNVSLLVGGPDGLSGDCLRRADEVWCLSPLTFPHPLVRVIVAEQLYRAWSLLQHHPYHR